MIFGLMVPKTWLISANFWLSSRNFSEIYCYTNFFCYAFVFGPNFRRGKNLQEGKLSQGCPLPPCGRKPDLGQGLSQKVGFFLIFEPILRTDFLT